MKFSAESTKRDSKSRASGRGGAGLFCSVAVLALCSSMSAQSPNPAASSPAKANPGGFTPGWTLGAKFEDGYSSDGSVYDLGSALGYNFSRYFGIDAGVPFYFVSTPSSIKNNDPGAVSGIGVGTFFTDLRLNYPNPSLNFSSAVHLTAPTGETKKGLSTGHATWNLANHIDHAFGDFSPFLDFGAGNTVMDTRFFHRPFITFGYNAQFNGGIEYDLGKFSFSASAYDVAPWGNQTVISRVFRCGSAAKCNAGGATKNRQRFTTASVSAGAADLVRDNGYNAGIDYKPVGYLDLEFDYSRSVPLQLNSYSFAVGVDLSWLLRPHVR
ncbi:MAG: hypothetical protein DMG56_10250 [Acidobacteria bacterium]|nr:MAG: hypothetical protein DMG55_25475 [Acidobacteriota bacterium]PYU63281.1 MAG: hypothetical protein DMG56_10250 [Acidobacteriota bacterium]